MPAEDASTLVLGGITARAFLRSSGVRHEQHAPGYPAENACEGENNERSQRRVCTRDVPPPALDPNPAADQAPNQASLRFWRCCKSSNVVAIVSIAMPAALVRRSNRKRFPSGRDDQQGQVVRLQFWVCD
jgi:hypothetical protein